MYVHLSCVSSLFIVVNDKNGHLQCGGDAHVCGVRGRDVRGRAVLAFVGGGWRSAAAPPLIAVGVRRPALPVSGRRPNLHAHTVAGGLGREFYSPPAGNRLSTGLFVDRKGV